MPGMLACELLCTCTLDTTLVYLIHFSNKFSITSTNQVVVVTRYQRSTLKPKEPNYLSLKQAPINHI